MAGPPGNGGKARQRWLWAAVLALAAALAVAALLWLAIGQRAPQKRTPVARAATPRTTARAAVETARPAPLSTAPPSPAPQVVQHLSVTLPWPTEPTPTPFPTLPPRPGPRPTPTVTSCVALRWWANRASPAPGQILIEIEAENRCGRDLDPLEVWFVATGYRQGHQVQTVQGHLFDPLYKDGEGRTAIGLPGSPDWYDNIEVRLVEPRR